MSQSIKGLPKALPHRFPVGATYVVEGSSGKDDFRVISRYVVLPGGRRIDVPSDLSRPGSPRALAFLRAAGSRRSPSGTRSGHAQKKIAGRAGTG